MFTEDESVDDISDAPCVPSCAERSDGSSRVDSSEWPLPSNVGVLNGSVWCIRRRPGANQVPSVAIRQNPAIMSQSSEGPIRHAYVSDRSESGHRIGVQLSVEATQTTNSDDTATLKFDLQQPLLRTGLADVHIRWESGGEVVVRVPILGRRFKD